MPNADFSDGIVPSRFPLPSERVEKHSRRSTALGQDATATGRVVDAIVGRSYAWARAAAK
jgi:hypothetical protein